LYNYNIFLFINVRYSNALKNVLFRYNVKKIKIFVIGILELMLEQLIHIDYRDGTTLNIAE